MLTKVDLQNILALIAKASLSGNEALTVAILQDKLGKMLQAEIAMEEKTNKDVAKEVAEDKKDDKTNKKGK